MFASLQLNDPPKNKTKQNYDLCNCSTVFKTKYISWNKENTTKDKIKESTTNTFRRSFKKKVHCFKYVNKMIL